MVEKIFKDPDIYLIHVPLPGNPLKNLNSYVIKSSSRNLIIDTGFNMPECHEALLAGLKELGVSPDVNTDIYATHFHSDHIGLVPKLKGEDTKVYLHPADYDYVKGEALKTKWDEVEEKFILESFPEEKVYELRKMNPARIYAPERVFDAELLNDNDTFSIDGLEFRAIYTPGHTPGHMCLYIESEKVLFLGDHVLFDITPNITNWVGVGDSLRDYLDSLEKVKKLSVKTPLPAHRNVPMDMYERIEQLFTHHKNRLSDTVNVLEKEKDLTAYEIAGKMKWNMRGKGWEAFPDSQKWFAVGETLAHLDYLAYDNLVVREEVVPGKKYVYNIK